jgi:Domain of unknown function (DUF4166)
MQAAGTLVGHPTDTAPAARRRAGLRGILGDAAWQRLPAAVRVRFGEPPRRVDYVGEFEVVRASCLGRVLAFLCRLLGTPVVPRTGTHVPAVVHVGPSGSGVAWNREYRWPDERYCLVRSTKTIEADGRLVERLPARLCMPLDVYERAGTLHFVSRGYYFELGRRGHSLKMPLPSWLSPGTTHVEHRNEPDGWFRFTMTVAHPFLGELFYQTGRFRAAKELS